MASVSVSLIASARLPPPLLSYDITPSSLLGVRSCACSSSSSSPYIVSYYRDDYDDDDGDVLFARLYKFDDVTPLILFTIIHHASHPTDDAGQVRVCDVVFLGASSRLRLC